MRRSGRPTALALIDVDDFKTMNDTHGHRHGDSVLELVADVIGDACRATDEPARYGGDELAVILAETDLDGAHTIAENLRRAVEGAVLPLPDGSTARVTISVGVGAMAPGAGDPAALIEARRRRPLRGQADRQEPRPQRRLGRRPARRRD